MIPYSKQSIEEQDREAVLAVLRSDFLTQGPKVPEFEQALAEYCNATEAVAANSATSALHLACMALEIGPGDPVWTSPISFVASANCARYCGADVDFVDIDENTGNLSVAALEQKLEFAASQNKLPKAVIPVHLAGAPCDMESIKALSESYGFSIIEDASHALGSTYQNHKIGSGTYSDLTVFSFHPVKMITTAEGGAAMTNDSTLAEKMRQLRTHGITRDSKKLENTNFGAWYYEQQQLGYNYRLSDLHAALGRAQLARLDSFVENRAKAAAYYHQQLEEQTLISLPPQDAPECQSSWHLFIVRLASESARHAAFDRLRKEGFGVQVHYIPIHLQPYYKQLGFRAGDFPAAEQFYAHILSLPLFPGIERETQDRVVSLLSNLME